MILNFSSRWVSVVNLMQPHSIDNALTDRADELHGNHTLFGRVVGDTLYSTYVVYYSSLCSLTVLCIADALKIGEMGDSCSIIIYSLFDTMTRD